MEAPEGFIYTLDGELIEGNRFTAEVAHNILRFAVPKQGTPISAAHIACRVEAKPEEKALDEALV